MRLCVLGCCEQGRGVSGMGGLRRGLLEMEEGKISRQASVNDAVDVMTARAAKVRHGER